MFEDTLVMSRRKRDARRRLAVAPLALIFHALVIGVFMVGQIFAVGPVPEPNFIVSFYTTTPPPPAEGRPGKPKGPDKAVEKTKTAPPVTFAQPETVPDKTAEPLDPEISEPPGEEGVEGGARREGGNGPSIIKNHSEPVDLEPQAPIVISAAVVAPVLLYRAAPVYPELARKVRVEGTVVVQAVIDAHGNVIDAKILRDIGFGCGDTAIAAIHTWKYEPATLNGKRVAVYLTVSVTFTIQRS